MSETEEWRDVLGYEGLYQVSNLGRVKSMERRQRCSHGTKRCPGRMLKLTYNAYGYLIAGLYREGILKPTGAHRLVCAAFHGPPPTEKHQACHSNGIRDDNRLANLRWATVKDNHRDRDRHGNTARGERGGNAQLTNAQAAEIRKRAIAEKQVDLAAAYGVSANVICRIVNRHTYTNT